MAKSREELLSEETRAAAENASHFLQWGVTLMVSLQTALYFVRRDAANALIESGQLAKGSEVPIERYFLGTGFLIFIAIVLSMLNARATAQYRNYKVQLIQCRESGVKDLEIRYTGRWAYLLYAIFPVIDILARAWIDISIHFNIHFR
jgi:hypothetical protein